MRTWGVKQSGHTVGTTIIPSLPFIILPLASCLIIDIFFTSLNSENSSCCLMIIFLLSCDTNKSGTNKAMHIEILFLTQNRYQYTQMFRKSWYRMRIEKYRRFNGNRT